MSGIAGIYNLNNQPVEAIDLGKMVDRMAHRGPDGAEIWCDESVGFGHRMLWTTPESLLEKLPWVDHRCNLAITADARIDNREELIAKLGLCEYPAEKITDSQLILAAYEKWGENSPEKLLGAFAFAIWDGHQQQLFCARDHMGVNPFYYHYKPGQIFTFSSEIKALFCLESVPYKLNEVKIADYLAVMYEDKSNTFFEDIFRLPPASSMIIRSSGINIQSYWSLNPNYELRLNSDQEYAEALREIFTEAVRCRLRSAYPVGSHLSGGLDSSAVTCVARQLLETQNRPLHTFSNIFDHLPQCDERPFIEAVLEQDGLIPHFIQADQLGPLSDWETIFDYHDEVFFGPTHSLVWVKNKAIHQQGVRVVLDGFDGDTTISHGDSYFLELAQAGKWSDFATEAEGMVQLYGGIQANVLRNRGVAYLEELAKSGKWFSFLKNLHSIRQYFDISAKELIVDHGLKAAIPLSWQYFFREVRGIQEKFDREHWIINKKFTDRIGYEKRFQDFKGFQSRLPRTERESHWRLLNRGIITSALETINHSSQPFSLEVRHPFMDKRLIEFCLSLPPQQKLHQGWSRLVMRRAMENILPPKVQWRMGKSNLSPSCVYGLITWNQQIMERVINQDLKDIEMYINKTHLRQAYDRLIHQKPIKYNEHIEVLKAVNLHLWIHKNNL